MRTRGTRIGLFAIVAVTLSLSAACAGTPAASEPTTTYPTNIPTARSGGVKEGNQLYAMAKVIPSSNSDVGFDTSGVISEVLVKEGDTVDAGAPLARLDVESLQLQVDAAEANLAEAKASEQELLAGATPDQITIAKTQLERARAQLLGVKADYSPQDVQAAQKQLDQTRLRLQRIKAGATPEDIRASQAGIDAAEAELAAVRARTAAAKTMAESEMKRAANVLRDRQAEYNRVYWSTRSGGGAGPVEPEEIDREAAALRAVDNAAEAFKERQVEFDQAKQVEVTGIRAAEAHLTEQQAQYDALTRPPTPDQIAGIEADIASAQAHLDRLTGDKKASDIDIAQTGVLLAEANVNALSADTKPSSLALAQAHILRAEVGLKEAKLALERSTLVSPWPATIARLEMRAGQSVEARETVATLADFSNWQLQTEDLSEVSIVHVREGSPVVITFAALPDVQLPGEVTKISLLGTSDKNVGATYAVTITPSRWDDRLRWNMTASVAIQTDS